jgi:hypothetical protein
VVLVLVDSEARRLLPDFCPIGGDLLAKVASQAATNITPDPERLRNGLYPAI